MCVDRLLCTECVLSHQMGKAEGIINDEIPNCWECPKCHKEGKTSKVRARPVHCGSETCYRKGHCKHLALDKKRILLSLLAGRKTEILIIIHRSIT